jgi:hypothetical protein
MEDWGQHVPSARISVCVPSRNDYHRGQWPWRQREHVPVAVGVDNGFV